MNVSINSNPSPYNVLLFFLSSLSALLALSFTINVSNVETAVGLDRNTATQIAVDLVLERPNNRQDEFEADQRGLQTLGRANYAQSAMISFMKKLLNSDSGPTFLNKHPATSKRIAALQRAIDSQKANVGDGLDNAAYKAKIQPLNQA